MSESTSGKMTRPSSLILISSILLLMVCACVADPAAHLTPEPSAPSKSHPIIPIPVAERKADHVSDGGKEQLKSQASDSGYGQAPNDYNNQQQGYQPPPPPPPPAQAYGQQVHVTEQDYPQQQQNQQPYEPPHPQPYDQGYGTKGQQSRPQSAYSSQQQAYPQQQQQQSYNQQPSAPQQSYPSQQQQQQTYPSSNYNSHPENSYGASNAYQSSGSYNSNNNNAASSQSYGTPLESTYESPADYANDPEDDLPYDNSELGGHGTSAPLFDQQLQGKGQQGYQVAGPAAQNSYPPTPSSYPSSSYPAPAAPAPYPPQDQGYGNGASGQEPSPPPAAPSKGGYAPVPSGNSYASPAASDSGSASYPHANSGSDSRGAPHQQQSYPETSYSYGQQQQYQQQQGSNYNMPLNYGGFRPIQLVAHPVAGNTYNTAQKGTPSKPLVVAIIQKPSGGQQQNSQYSAQAPAQGNHYNVQLPAYHSQDNHQYQSQQIPANSYSGPPLPLHSYASPHHNGPASYQSTGSHSAAPHRPNLNAPYPSSSGANAQYQGQGQNYPSEVPQHYGQAGHVPGYEFATEQESSDDEYSHPAGHPVMDYATSSYNPASPGYPEYPKAAAAQPYTNAGFALDYATGKPYGGRWLRKPYGKKFVKPKKTYAGNGDSFDVSIPLQYGPPPPPEEPKAAPQAAQYLAPYASMPQASIYPEESSVYAFGSPLRSAPLSSTFPAKSYRNPSLTQSFGSYGVQNHNLRIPSASSYGTLTSDESDAYVSTLAVAGSPVKQKKQRPVADLAAAGVAASLPEDETTGYKLIPSASKLIPNIVKSPIKKIMKAFSKNKLLSWKRKEAKSVTKD